MAEPAGPDHALAHEEFVGLFDGRADRGGAKAEFALGLGRVGPAFHAQDRDGAGGQALGDVGEVARQDARVEAGQARHDATGDPQLGAPAAGHGLEVVEQVVQGLERGGEDVLVALAAALHGEQVALDDVVGGDEGKAPRDVGPQAAGDVVAEGPSEPGRDVVVGTDDGAAGGDHHVEPVRDELEGLVLGLGLGAGVGQHLAEGIEGHVLVGRPRGVLWVVAHGREGARQDDPLDAGFEGRLHHVAGAEDVRLEQLAKLPRARAQGGDLGGDVEDVGAAPDEAAHGRKVPHVAFDDLDG